MDSKRLANYVRRQVLAMTSSGASSHIGSILSCTDILATLYAQDTSGLNVDPARPLWPERDRFILSKGHAGAGVYAILAGVGFFDEELLLSHYQNGSVLSGHVSHKGVPGVEFSTGSLGHGLSVAAGKALAIRDQHEASRVFVLLSDGELNEGSNWEAIMFAAHHRLSNLIMMVDANGLQSLRSTVETLNLEPISARMEAFDWVVIEVDGHDHEALSGAYKSARVSEMPTCIICRTIKGKGVSFMENEVVWHYKSPSDEDVMLALKELSFNDES